MYIHKNLTYKFLITFILFNIVILTYGIQLDISGDIWNRYTLRRYGGHFKKSYFSLEQGLFSFQPKISDKITGNFSVNIYGGPSYYDYYYYDYLFWRYEIKSSYIEFNQLIPAIENKLMFGLDKIYFGLLYDWDYLTIEKTLEEKEDVLSYQDFGLRFSGYIDDYGEYAISIINGELGYYNNDLNPALVANLRLAPAKLITFGGSIYYEKPTWYEYVTDTFKYRNVIGSGILKVNSTIVDLTFEYLTQNYRLLYPQVYEFITNSRGIMIMPVVKLKPLIGYDFDIVLRYDWWDANTEMDSNAVSTIIGGLNYNILRDKDGAPNLIMQINWEREIHEYAPEEPVDQILAQLRWRFNSRILN